MRLFFDFVDGHYTTRDREGHECASPEAARLEVLRALPEVLLGDLQDQGEREVVCSVRDGCGFIMYRASVTLKAQVLPNR